MFTELNGDQRREAINTAQRHAAWREAKARASGYRGSVGWHTVSGEDYLVRSYYDGSGIRRQKTEGRRDARTEAVAADWHAGRHLAKARFRQMSDVLDRQSAVNRALRLGRVPLLGARLIRAIDEAGLLGRGIRVVGTNAIYAYEAAAGVSVDAAITTTEDIDLLFDARRSLRITSDEDVKPDALLEILKTVDRSFQRRSETFRAVNRDGYLVDLIKPTPNPPWAADREGIGDVPGDLAAVSIEGLAWHQSSPAFEALAIDEKGGPVRIVASDPRVFAAHKLWLSQRPDRDPMRRRRDAEQARTVAQIVARYLIHLPFDRDALRMIPLEVFRPAQTMFQIADRA